MTHDQIDQIQRRFGFDTRSDLHNKVLEVTGADESEVDVAVLDYCRDENDRAFPRLHELTFKDVV